MTFTPIFIVGNSRSGTTLLARILSRHSNVYILNETHFLTTYEKQRKFFSQLGRDEKKQLINSLLTVQQKGIYRKNEYQEYPAEAEKILATCKECPTFSSILSAFFQYIAFEKGKTLSGDQTPAHIFHVEEILKLFPHAKFINSVRDPRAVLLSQKNKWKAAKRLRQPISEIIRTFFNYHPLTISLLWKKGIVSGRNAEKNLSPDIFHTVHFEQLLKQPEYTIRNICNFLMINFEEDMLNVDVSMSSNQIDEGKKGICPEVISHWEKCLNKTEIFISEIINGKIAKREGYQLTQTRPSVFSLLFYIIYFPIHLSASFFMNINRIGNPIRYISSMIFNKNYI